MSDSVFSRFIAFVYVLVTVATGIWALTIIVRGISMFVNWVKSKR